MSIDKLMSDYKFLCDKIRVLESERSFLKSEILSLLDFNPDGQKTIEYAPGKKVTVKAGLGYKVNAERATEIMNDIPEDFNPFTEQVSYKLDKKKFDMLKLYPEYLALVEPCVEAYPKPVTIEVK